MKYKDKIMEDFGGLVFHYKEKYCRVCIYRKSIIVDDLGERNRVVISGCNWGLLPVESTGEVCRYYKLNYGEKGNIDANGKHSKI